MLIKQEFCQLAISSPLVATFKTTLPIPVLLGSSSDRPFFVVTSHGFSPSLISASQLACYDTVCVSV